MLLLTHSQIKNSQAHVSLRTCHVMLLSFILNTIGILCEPTKYLLTCTTCIFSKFSSCVNMFLIHFQIHVCLDHLHQPHSHILSFLCENIIVTTVNTYCQYCIATTVFDYQNGVVPSFINDLYHTFLNRCNTT